MTFSEIEYYLAKNLGNIDLIVEQVVSLLPDSYFYSPEIKQGEFLEARESIDDLIQKKNYFAFRNDSYVQIAYQQELSRYEKMLKDLADAKRKNLLEELLIETDEVKCGAMMSLIRHYKLLKHLRTFD